MTDTIRTLAAVGGVTLLAATIACRTPEPAPAPEAAPAADAAPVDTTATTREVVQRHLKTFGASDLEGIIADYADDAVMHTPNGPIEGKEALRTAFQGFIAEWGQPGTTFNLTKEEYRGESGYINWTAETSANVYEYGVDGFIVRDGKIVSQFFGAKMTAKK